MPVIKLTTVIDAPIERVFDISRSIDAHVASNAKAPEVPIRGKTTGLIGLDEEVTWQARKFGLVQKMRVRITEFRRPEMFTDEMVTGAFKFMKHVHRFRSTDGQTEMIDEFAFKAPFGLLGRIVEAVVLTRFMRSFLIERNRILKEIVESDRWKTFLDEENSSSSPG